MGRAKLLSVLIPARNEQFLNQTIQSVLKNRRGSTECLVVLDGQWPVEPIPDHPDVHLLFHAESVGQRAATNEAAALSRATYVMKLDAHCDLDEGFDVKLAEPYEKGELERTDTTIPRLYNLHCFDWVCDTCGHHTYQGPDLAQCQKAGCPGKTFHKEIVWKPRLHKRSDFCRFDETLHFGYWRSYERRPEAKGDLCEVMGGLGACFFMQRDRFLELGGVDEKHGSWGAYGTEISLKSWLSGGRQMVNKRAFYAHAFRTQGGSWGFPYPLSTADVEKARAYSRNLWMNNAWPQQVRPLSWVIDRFWPVPGWSEPQGAEALAYARKAGETFLRTHGTPAPVAPRPTETAKAPAVIVPPPPSAVLYTTDSHCDPLILSACQQQLRRAAGDRPICCVSLAPVEFGDYRFVLPLERGPFALFSQLLAGLETLDGAEYVFLAHHDVLYSPEHFDLVPESHTAYYYDTNFWQVHAETGHALFYHRLTTAGLVAHRDLLIQHYRTRLQRIEREGQYDTKIGYEPGAHRTPRGIDDFPARIDLRSDRPNIDIRHAQCLTRSRWKLSQFRDKSVAQSWAESAFVPGWGVTEGRMTEFLREIADNTDRREVA